MPFQAALARLLVAPLGSVLVVAVWLVWLQTPRPSIEPLILVLVRVWALSLAAAIGLVMPVLAAVPRLRRPSLWLAVSWGVAAAWVASAVLFGPARLSVRALFEFGLAGAASGAVYSIAARWP